MQDKHLHPRVHLILSREGLFVLAQARGITRNLSLLAPILLPQVAHAPLHIARDKGNANVLQTFHIPHNEWQSKLMCAEKILIELFKYPSFSLPIKKEFLGVRNDYAHPVQHGNGYAADKMARSCHAFPFPCPHAIRPRPFKRSNQTYITVLDYLQGYPC
ncbi:hypothetical protein SUGI_0946910 [Cryptomeria japonica]|nr:hypothetical protein SUGI_0946910 [Cryptomeria japonica]